MKSFLKWFGGDSKEVKGSLPSLADISGLNGKRVLLRSSLNVPIENGQVTDNFRLLRSIPTIKYLQERGAKVILISHIGREAEESLRPVYEELKKSLELKWGGQLTGGVAAARELRPGEIILLENLRQDPREKANDDAFAQELANLADIYVNDAFAASHRAHTSIVGVPKYLPSYFGLNFIREYEGLQPALTPKSPSLLVIGGAKFETKLPLVEKFVTKYDQIVVGGALANDFYKAKGYEVGQSLVSEIDLKATGLLNNKNVSAPGQVVVKRGDGSEEVVETAVQKDDSIVDAGLTAIKDLTPQVQSAKTILWNGPLGNYELGFSAATEELARQVANSEAYSVVGGGDTVASIRSLGLEDKFGFLSTAGGAMLTFLETGTLPAIEVVVGK